MNWRLFHLHLAGSFLIFLLVTPVTQAADDYLSAIEAEAGDTGSVTVTRSATVSRMPGQRDRKVMMPALSYEAFEQELKEGYSGTWFLYEKLSADQRHAVYDRYLKDSRISVLRDEIVRLLSSG